MVGAILEYTRWPRERSPLQLCVVGPPQHGDRLGGIVLAGGRLVERHDVAEDAGSMGGACDALYLGRLSLPAMRRWTAQMRGAAVVTIAEDDPACESEAMFCLLFTAESLTFRLNIDAVSRSGVRIDPRILRMSVAGF